MEGNINPDIQNIKVKVSELIKKFKTRQDIYDYCREQNYYFPAEAGYDTSFFINFLKGTKSLLKLVNHTDFKLKYYRTENVLTKKFLINLIKENPIYIRYLPDAVNLEKLSKNFLFSLITNLDPPTYAKLYEMYKNKESNKIYKKWEDFEISLPGNVLNKTSSFRPINSQATNKKNFRLSKNHMPTNLFSYVGKNSGVANEGIDDISLNNNELNDGNIPNNGIQLSGGNIIRINVAKNKESNEEAQINNIIEEEE